VDQQGTGGDIIDVFQVDFKVVDWLAAGARSDRGDTQICARRAAKALADLQLASGDEIVAIFGPERMVRGDADWFVKALDR